MSQEDAEYAAKLLDHGEAYVNHNRIRKDGKKGVSRSALIKTLKQKYNCECHRRQTIATGTNKDKNSVWVQARFALAKQFQKQLQPPPSQSISPQIPQTRPCDTEDSSEIVSIADEDSDDDDNEDTDASLPTPSVPPQTESALITPQPCTNTMIVSHMATVSSSTTTSATPSSSTYPNAPFQPGDRVKSRDKKDGTTAYTSVYFHAIVVDVYRSGSSRRPTWSFKVKFDTDGREKTVMYAAINAGAYNVIASDHPLPPTPLDPPPLDLLRQLSHPHNNHNLHPC